MYILIRYPVGIIVEGVVLARGPNRLRVAAAGIEDTIELKRSGKEWFTETRQPVEFDFLMSHAQSEESAVCSTPPRAAEARAITACQ
jgi:hypothetical protein